jgi:hypothetical protein
MIIFIDYILIIFIIRLNLIINDKYIFIIIFQIDVKLILSCYFN